MRAFGFFILSQSRERLLHDRLIGVMRALRLGTRPRGSHVRINIWIILGTLLALLAITRYMQHQGDTQRICANDPTASVCHR